MRVANFIIGFAVGVVLGGVAVLLTTPQSGDALQSDLRSRWEQAKSEGKDAFEARRAELEARLSSLKSG
ncbi:MAG: hypothetical protein R3264_01765 [Anaerolineae bacterium]|nr:hypothetical protein [Anaerolineae bacterium]